MTKKKIAAIVLATAVVSSGLTLAGLGALLDVGRGNFGDVVRFFAVRRFIEARYVEDVDPHKLMEGAINGMVSSLGDPHSIYMDPEMFHELRDQTEGSFGGIGVTMGFKDSRVTIISVLPDTPGAAGGLKAGDEILAVDGTPVSEWQPEEVAFHIRGEVGTDVTLSIRREGEEDRDYTLTRGTIQLRSVHGKILDGTEIGYIRITSFAENTGSEFKETYEQLGDEGMKGLVIDLRENPGGLITSCVDVAKLLVPKGPIVSVVERDGSKDEYTSDLEAPAYPVVVLIDGNSASASEILSGALQDTGAATIVGTTSYGKGSVQVVVPMLHNDGLKLTIAKYYTPNGRMIDGIGIEPDVKVELPADGSADTQLEKAKEILTQKIGNQ